MVNIEIPTSEHRTIPEKYFGVILDEIYRVLSLPNNNKGYNIKVDSISLRYQNPNLGTIPCSIEDAQIICVNVKFERLRDDKSKGGTYQLRSGHVGLQVFLPKKIKARRDSIISNILDLES